MIAFIIFSILTLPMMGLYSLKMIFNDEIRKNPAAKEIIIDADVQDVEKVIENGDEEFIEKLLQEMESPIKFEDIKKAHEKEKLTYSQEKYMYDIDKRRNIIIKDLLKDRIIKKTNEKIEVQENPVTIDYAETEYPYRLNWQLISAINFYKDKNAIKETMQGIMPVFTYMYPAPYNILYDQFDNPFEYIKRRKKGGEIEEILHIKPQNHVVLRNNTHTIPFKKDFTQEDDDWQLDDNVNRYHSVEQELTIIEKIHREKTEDGWETVKHEREYITDTTKIPPFPLLINISSISGGVRNVYERRRLMNHLKAYDEVERKKKDSDGNTVKKIKIKTWKYQSYDKMVIQETKVTDGSQQMANFLDSIEIGRNNIDDLKNIVSLYPGGFFVSQNITGSAFSKYKYYNLSLANEFSMLSFGSLLLDIRIEPSELLLPIPRFSQIDTRWSSIPYGDSTIGRGGCGPTSAAMVITGITKNVVTPVRMANYSVARGHKVPSGTSWAFFQDAGEKYGLEVIQYTPGQYREMLEELKRGNPVIASMAPGHFTREGHFIVLVGIDENGMIIVNDSYDPHNIKNKSWDFRIVLNETKQFWVFKKEKES